MEEGGCIVIIGPSPYSLAYRSPLQSRPVMCGQTFTEQNNCEELI